MRIYSSVVPAINLRMISACEYYYSVLVPMLIIITCVVLEDAVHNRLYSVLYHVVSAGFTSSSHAKPGVDDSSQDRRAMKTAAEHTCDNEAS